MNMSGGSETNLLSIILNIAFGFVAGLMYFFGVMEVIAYGSELAAGIMKTTGYGQMGGFNIATAAPYIILAPLAGMVAKQLSSVNSFKGFLYFALAVAAGGGVAYLTQGYFVALIG